MEAFMLGLEAAPEAADRMRLHEASPAAPYHIVNTNVVLINAKSRRRCIRGGDSFILTRDYCGSNATGWCATREFMNDGMTLPTAVAISGAGGSPGTDVGGVGLSRSRVVSALMALLNLRLGYWVPHPGPSLREDGTWTDKPGKNQEAVPNHFHPGLSALLFGYSEDYGFQELTDGGHFENLGIYELIRRRVRLILVCDAAADADYRFPDLQKALQRIGEDFGAKIEFLESYSMEDIIPHPGGHSYPRGLTGDRTYPRGLELARRAFAIANVYYPPDFDADGHIRRDADPGLLIYIKKTMIARVSLELREYKANNPEFPHQSTSDYFFDQDQFESYRELGYRIADSMITDLGLKTTLENIQPAV